MNKVARFSILILVALFIAGASCQNNIKTPDQMTPKERGVLALTLYNNAFANYNAQFMATPKPLNSVEQDYFKAYKGMMEVAWPVISAYTAVVNVGGVPTPEQEQQIILLIYKLQAILMGVKS